MNLEFAGIRTAADLCNQIPMSSAMSFSQLPNKTLATDVDTKQLKLIYIGESKAAPISNDTPPVDASNNYEK
jgi:hypothetical protein